MKPLVDSFGFGIDPKMMGNHFQKHINTYADDHPTLLVRQLATRLRAALVTLDRLNSREPVAWMAQYINKDGEINYYTTTIHDLAIENDMDENPVPLFVGTDPSDLPEWVLTSKNEHIDVDPLHVQSLRGIIT